MRKPVAWKARLVRELGRPQKLAVLGVGNVAKSDDGAGVRTAEALARLVRSERNARLKIVIGHEAPENFTGAVRHFRPSHVLIIDAAGAGFPPGAVFLVDRSGIQNDDVSTHRTPLTTLAAYLEETVGCRVVILGIEPETLVPGALLSRPVQAAAEAAATYLAGFAKRRLRSSSA
jgi:hydrogenase 3 maturation protease